MTAAEILAMSDEEMRLRFGEMTAQEIRTVRAVLKVVEKNERVDYSIRQV